MYKNNFSLNADIKSILINDYIVEKNDNPTLSFLIPTYNRPETIQYAIESIVNQKGIEEIGYEIVIVDNSADFTNNNETKKLMLENSKYPIRYYINEINIGPEGNWNRGIELCKSKYISILHDDDLLAETYVRDVMGYLSSIPDIEKVPFVKIRYLLFRDYANLPNVQNSETQKPVLRQCDYLRALLNGECETNTPTCGMLFNKKLVMKVGGFNPDYNPSGDSKLGEEFISSGLIGYTTTRASGLYHIGINDSMKLKTIQNFLKQDYQIRNDLYALSALGKIFGKVFERTHYSMRIDHWIKYADSSFHLNLTIQELDFLNCYKRHKLKKITLKILTKAYNLFLNKRFKVSLTEKSF